jgi:hypothetical protein
MQTTPNSNPFLVMPVKKLIPACSVLFEFSIFSVSAVLSLFIFVKLLDNSLLSLIRSRVAGRETCGTGFCQHSRQSQQLSYSPTLPGTKCNMKHDRNYLPASKRQIGCEEQPLLSRRIVERQAFSGKDMPSNYLLYYVLRFMFCI